LTVIRQQEYQQPTPEKHHEKTHESPIHRHIADLLAIETKGANTLQAICRKWHFVGLP
jgi:hypothetical protein